MKLSHGCVSGLVLALFLTPAMLYQTDEIDGLLQSINRARDARHENIHVEAASVPSRHP